MAILGSSDGGAKLGKFDLDVKSKMVCKTDLIDHSSYIGG